MPPGITFLYTITHVDSGRMYVGVARNPKGRWRDHRKRAGKPVQMRQLVHKAIAKYGSTAFRFEVVACAFTWEDGLQIERDLIRDWQTHVTAGGFNLTDGGEGKAGMVYSIETRAKIGAHSSRRVHTAETRAQIGASLKGRPCSEETREKRRKTLLARYAANPAPKRGPMSEEHKDAIRRSQIGKIISEECRAKMRAAHARRRQQRGE